MKKIRGKILGTLLGFAFGGPWGGALGLVAGHAYDLRRDGSDSFWNPLKETAFSGFGANLQEAFTMGVVVLGAKMAKSDGRVTREEIEAFKRVFHISEAQTGALGKAFDQARKSADGFEPYAFQLAQLFHSFPVVLEEILGGLFVVASADSAGLSPAELRFLRRVAAIFEFNTADFARIAARAGVRLPEQARPRDESYVILGVREEASAEEIKTAYRVLIREHHPDKLVAQGMPPEFIATATEKMKRINGAYDTVCRARGIK